MRRTINVFAFRHVASVWRITLGLLVAGCLFAEQTDAMAQSDDSVVFTISVKSSEAAKYETGESYKRSDWSRAWEKAKTEKLLGRSSLYTDTYVDIAEGGEKRRYAMREDGMLFELGGDRSVMLPAKVRKQWRGYAVKLRKRHYGEIVEWDDVKSRVPLKAVATVVDLETGLSFQAQRRAGSSHADVQPLTREDTAVMKQIYGGTWSWKRRAILVLSDGPPIAASMHGMPHGGDGIPDNDFSGHFCIHFLGSTTHGSGRADLSHQLMVHKAAGKLSDLFQSSTPEQLTEALFDSLHQQDEAIVRAVLQGSPSETLKTFLEWLHKVEAVRMEPLQSSDTHSESVTAEIPIRVTWNGRGGGVRLETVRLLFARETVQSPWIITSFEQGKKR